ncbi:hypothetical protein CFC21_000680 [Triticum aestivum]|uniref:Uncharacterized protein n=1 Tax=Triticum aestivum TaxID=4565 RepID=A0A3B5XUU5_WHEAT|nr:uncharacterized protein LOC119351023 [Triticum dicoccoides]XP_044365024.1 uncharacterized protein LOC123087137 [Triticum aestivum]KAF6982264.1 hypothetical protein CFC21_000680 [Triticum aestivum]
MALAFTSSVPFPAAAAPGLLQQQQQQVHVVGGGRVLLLGSAPSPGSGTLVLAVSVPAVGGAKAPAPLRCACAAGDNASPSDKEKAFLEAMEEARGKFHAVISAGDKTVLERLAITAKDSLGLLASMTKDHPFPLPDAMYQEVARITWAFLEVEGECEGGYASADTVLAAIDALRNMSVTFLGSGVDDPEWHPAFLGDVSDEEDKANYLLNLANGFCLFHFKLLCRYRQASPAMEEEAPVVAYKYPYQAMLVQNDKDLAEHLRTTAKDCQGFLARMMAKVRVLPLPDVVCEELIAIGKSFVRVEVECDKGCATTGSVVAAMDGLTRVTEIIAGSGRAKTLKPYDLRPTVAITGDQEKLAFMWDLAAAFSVHFYDVKFRCADFF